MDENDQGTGAVPPPPDAGARVDLPAPPVATSTAAPAAPAASTAAPASDSGSLSDRATAAAAAAQDKPELVIAGAFVAAFLFARILKRIGGE